MRNNESTSGAANHQHGMSHSQAAQYFDVSNKAKFSPRAGWSHRWLSKDKHN